MNSLSLTLPPSRTGITCQCVLSKGFCPRRGDILGPFCRLVGGEESEHKGRKTSSMGYFSVHSSQGVGLAYLLNYSDNLAFAVSQKDEYSFLSRWPISFCHNSWSSASKGWISHEENEGWSIRLFLVPHSEEPDDLGWKHQLWQLLIRAAIAASALGVEVDVLRKREWSRNYR